MDGAHFSEIAEIKPLYDSVYAALGGTEEGFKAPTHSRSVPPVWMDALEWLHDVDRTVTAWVLRHRLIACVEEGQNRPSTIEYLRSVQRAVWAPEDQQRVEQYERAVSAWVEDAEQMISGKSRYGLRDTPCPACGKRHVRRRNEDGRWGNTEALQVSMEQARCLACGHVWDSSLFTHLGRILGVEPNVA